MQRTRLWLRRNRTLAASLTAITVALLAGTGVALWQANEARTQAQIAQRESESARTTLAFLTDTLAAASPEQALSKEVGVRQLLDHARTQHEPVGDDFSLLGVFLEDGQEEAGKAHIGFRCD